MSNRQIVQLVIALVLLFGGAWAAEEFQRLRHENARLSDDVTELEHRMQQLVDRGLVK